jgi:hypothetical protein
LPGTLEQDRVRYSAEVRAQQPHRRQTQLLQGIHTIITELVNARVSRLALTAAGNALQRLKQTTPRGRKEESPSTRSRRVAGRWNPATPGSAAALDADLPTTPAADVDATSPVTREDSLGGLVETSDKERTESGSGDDQEPCVEIVEQQCYDVDGLDDVPLVLKILGLEHHQAEIFDVNPNMSVSVECGMYAHPPALL